MISPSVHGRRLPDGVPVLLIQQAMQAILTFKVLSRSDTTSWLLCMGILTHHLNLVANTSIPVSVEMLIPISTDHDRCLFLALQDQEGQTWQNRDANRGLQCYLTSALAMGLDPPLRSQSILSDTSSTYTPAGSGSGTILRCETDHEWSYSAKHHTFSCPATSSNPLNYTL